MPARNRDKQGLCYNPWEEGSLLIGGSFLTINGAGDVKRSEASILDMMESFWIWDFKSEKQLVEAIYRNLKQTADYVAAQYNGKISPLLCGIGINYSDIPVLFELFKRHNVLTSAEAFSFRNKFRTIDLSELSIGAFNNNTNVLYPKRKNDILSKYTDGKTFECGSSVWELYERQQYDDIVDRVKDEVYCNLHCYNRLSADFKRFKSMELESKKTRYDMSALAQKFPVKHVSR